jgi:hypothetical protein
MGYPTAHRETEQKRMGMCQQLLRYEREGDKYLCNIVAGDESWGIISSLKTRNSQWNTVTGSPAPKKFKTSPSTVKVMLTAL